ncbi:MAG: hypothetical protein ACOVQL_11125 [Limnohabitans sp.]
MQGFSARFSDVLEQRTMSFQNPDLWNQMVGDFQQNLARSWGQAMQNFQHLDLGGAMPQGTQGAPQIRFQPDRLQALQSRYFQEASEKLKNWHNKKIKIN